MVCLPNPKSDQLALAAQVALLGAGIALDGDSATPEGIGDAAMSILSAPSFTATAQRLADVIAAADAPASAMRWMESRAAALANNL